MLPDAVHLFTEKNDFVVRVNVEEVNWIFYGLMFIIINEIRSNLCIEWIRTFISRTNLVECEILSTYRK